MIRFIDWPVWRQLTGADRTARGAAAKSRATSQLHPRTATAARVA
jgi:formate dehydrogenase major subunit